MRYAKRIIAFFVLSAILLCMPLFSVSAAGCLTDWIPYGPYQSSFMSPAGPDSVVMDVQRSDGIIRRLVFPSGAFNFSSYYASDTKTFVVTYLCEGDKSYTTMYYGAGLSSYQILGQDPQLSYNNVYTYTIPLTSFELCGGVVSSPNFDFLFNTSSFFTVKPFPDENLIEEQKTQSMISQLISDIKDWFSNLIESMGNFFTELANKISGFFIELGDKIGGFFTTLWNKIWWGNEAGESEYEPPDVGSKFDEVIASLNDWLSQLKGFSDTVDSQGDEVAGYISTGSDFATKFLSYAPAPILIFLTFGIVFVVVRKVVGR